MNISSMSNTDLLAVLVGHPLAKALAAKPLTEIFGFCAPRQTAVSQDLAEYRVTPALQVAKELVARCFQEQMESGESLSSPAAVKGFLCARIGHLEYEVFWCLFLDAQNRLIAAEELFRGTLTQTSVYPREVVKKALAYNAAAIVFAHNHPSGVPEASRSDETLTRHLKQALSLVDTKVLDHFIVTGATALSFAERGLL